VVVVVPGNHGQELVDAPPTAGVHVDAGSLPVPGRELTIELERVSTPSGEGLERHVRIVAQVLPILGLAVWTGREEVRPTWDRSTTSASPITWSSEISAVVMPSLKT
jgi:hypothetical protein